MGFFLFFGVFGVFEEQNSFPKKARKSLCENLIGQEKVGLGGKKDFLSSHLLLRRFILLSSSLLVSLSLASLLLLFFRSSSVFWLLLLFYFLVECRLPFASLLSTPPFTLSPRRLATLFSLTSRSRVWRWWPKRKTFSLWPQPVVAKVFAFI